MKITKSYLKQIIKEELVRLNEGELLHLKLKPRTEPVSTQGEPAEITNISLERTLEDFKNKIQSANSKKELEALKKQLWSSFSQEQQQKHREQIMAVDRIINHKITQKIMRGMERGVETGRGLERTRPVSPKDPS